MRKEARFLFLAAAGLLVLPSPVNPQVGDILKLPPIVWEDINRLAFLVAFDFHEPGRYQSPNRIGKLDSYPELFAACRQWGNETFPAVQKLARELANDDIGATLTEMRHDSEQMNLAHGNAGEQEGWRTKFLEKSSALEARFGELAAISDKLTPQLERLRKASKAAIFEYKRRNFPPSEFTEVRADPDAVISALNLANNRWRSLGNHIRELRKLVKESRSQEEEAALYAKIGLETWKDAAKSAQGFMADLPRQQKFLTGENYHETCGVQEGPWYLIVNAAAAEAVKPGGNQAGGAPAFYLRLGFRRPAEQPPDFEIGGQLRLGRSEQGANQWRFKKLKWGYWKVVNRTASEYLFRNPEKTMAERAGNSVGVATWDLTRGMYWRLLPAASGSGCRFVNPLHGDTMALTARLRPGQNEAVYDVSMTDSTGAPDQLWGLTLTLGAQ
jgi:hypothetical protein